MVQTVESEATPVHGARLWPMSVEAYHVLGEAGVISKNTELLYGLVYTKTPKSPFHWFLLQRLLGMLAELNLPRHLVRSEQPLTFRDSEPEPDIAVVKGRAEDFRSKYPTSAELVIEVCVSSHEYDRSKLRAYAMNGVKEVWLVLGPEKRVEIYSEPREGSYAKQIVSAQAGVLRSQANSAIALDLTGLFA